MIKFRVFPIIFFITVFFIYPVKAEFQIESNNFVVKNFKIEKEELGENQEAALDIHFEVAGSLDVSGIITAGTENLLSKGISGEDVWSGKELLIKYEIEVWRDVRLWFDEKIDFIPVRVFHSGEMKTTGTEPLLNQRETWTLEQPIAVDQVSNKINGSHLRVGEHKVYANLKVWYCVKSGTRYLNDWILLTEEEGIESERSSLTVAAQLPQEEVREKKEDKEVSPQTETKPFTELLIGNIELSKDIVNSGEQVTVKVEVQNKGNTEAVQPVAELIFNDKERKAFASFNVPPNSSKIIETTFSAQSPLIETGRNLLRVLVQPSANQESIEKQPIIDYKDVYLEVKTLEVKEEKPMPNFVIYGNVTPISIEKPGQEVRVWFNIFNKGGVDSPITKAVVYVNGAAGQEFPIKSLMPWYEPAESEYKFIVNKAGKYEIKVVVDPDNQIEELKEDDNSYVNVAALDEFIDAALGDLGMSDSIILKEDGEIKIMPQVHNYGSVRADSLLSLYLDNRKVWGKTFRVEPNSTLSWPERVSISVSGEGEHTLTAEVVLYSDQVSLERNQDNNKKSYYIKILPPPLPDLKLKVMDFEPLILQKQGDKLTVTFSVMNEGQGKSPAATARMLIDDKAVKDFNVPALMPQQTQIFEHQQGIAGIGSHAVKIIINPEGKDVREARVKYNETGFSVELLGKIDVAVDSLTVSEDTPKDNDKVTLNVSIGNHGNIGAGAQLEIKIDDKEVILTTQGIMIPSGGSIPITKEFTVKGVGEHTITAVVTLSLEQQNLETNHGNNSKDISFQVQETDFTDLVVGDIEVNREPIKGEKVTVKIPVGNLGNVEAIGAVVIELEGKRLRTQAVHLPPHSLIGSKLVTAAFTADKAGTYKLYAEVSPNTSYKHLEKNQDNNSQEITIKVSETDFLDLSVGDIGVYRIEPEAGKIEPQNGNYQLKEGDLVLIRAEISNKGNIEDNITFSIAVGSEEFSDTGKISPQSSIPAGKRFKLEKLGEQKVKVNVEPSASFIDKNPRDNSKYASITVLAKEPYTIDLKANLAVSNAAPKLGEEIRLYFNVDNDSKIEAHALVEVKEDDRVLFSDSIAIAPYGSYVHPQGIALKTTKAGQQFFSIEVIPSPEYKQIDTNEADNYRSVEITVSPVSVEAPKTIDIGVEEITVSKDNPAIGEKIDIKVKGINYGVDSAPASVEIKLGDKVIYSELKTIFKTQPNFIYFRAREVEVNTAGTQKIIASVTVLPDYPYQDIKPDNNHKEIEIEVEDKELIPDFSSIQKSVQELYSTFKSSYSNGDIRGVLRCVSQGWESSTGQSFYDLDSRLNKIFSTFDRLSVDMGNFSVQASDDPEYAVRVSYHIKIEGSLISNPRIKHLDEGDVIDYIKKENNNYVIGKTIGKGAF